MQWDEELDRLAQYVRTHFGEEVLTAASRRAMAALRPTDLAVSQDYEGDDVIAAPSGDLYDLRAYLEALRRELQRLATPQ